MLELVGLAGCGSGVMLGVAVGDVESVEF